jgi:hypothetical protein
MMTCGIPQTRREEEENTLPWNEAIVLFAVMLMLGAWVCIATETL